MTPRVAERQDFPEILRLAHLLWADLGLDSKNGVESTHGNWESEAEAFFIRGLSQGTVKAFVVDNPAEKGVLVSCGVGVIMRQMPAFWMPTGEMGYLQWFVTVPEFRGRGLATGILENLLAWFRDENVNRIQLHGSEEALSIYKKVGFEHSWYANLWLRTDQ